MEPSNIHIVVSADHGGNVLHSTKNSVQSCDRVETTFFAILKSQWFSDSIS
jgi:hypothetical protein